MCVFALTPVYTRTFSLILQSVMQQV